MNSLVPRQVLWDAILTGRCKTSDGREVRLTNDAITPGVGLFLKKMVKLARAKSSVETGFGFGLSTLFICDALKKSPSSRHHAIDPFQNSPRAPWSGVGLSNVERAGFRSLVTFHETESHVALTRLKMDGTRVQFAFIDGDHAFDRAFVDYFLIDKILEVGGIVVFDDTDIASVGQVCSFVQKKRGYKRIAQLTDFGKLRCLAFKKTAQPESTSQRTAF